MAQQVNFKSWVLITSDKATLVPEQAFPVLEESLVRQPAVAVAATRFSVLPLPRCTIYCQCLGL